MKKILLSILVLAFTTAAFAADPLTDALKTADAEIAAAAEQFPKGTWIDPNYDAAWEFGVNNTIILKDSKTGEVYYNFTNNKRSNFKINLTEAGLVISFRCDETNRNYKFTKGLDLNTSIKLEIDADFLKDHYTVNMKMKN